MHPYYCWSCEEFHRDGDDEFDEHVKYKFITDPFDSAVLQDKIEEIKKGEKK